MKLVIQNIPPYDGEYPLPQINLRDASTIKQISKVRAGELQEALAAGDTDVLVAITVVTLQRNGFPEVNVDAIWDSDGGQITVKETAEDKAAEDSGRPPAEATSGGPQNESAAVAEQNEATQHSGETGTETGENNPETPPATGNPGSETSADFGQPI